MCLFYREIHVNIKHRKRISTLSVTKFVLSSIRLQNVTTNGENVQKRRNDIIIIAINSNQKMYRAYI